MFNLAVPRATPSLPSCSPNFPRASTTRYTHAKHGSILYFLVALNCSLFGERQLISEEDIFDLVWRLWGYFLPYYSHIYFYFFFLASNLSNLSNLTSVPKTELWVPQFEFSNSSSPIRVLQFQFSNSSSPIPVLQFQFSNSSSPIPVLQFQFSDSSSPIPVLRFQFSNAGP